MESKMKSAASRFMYWWANAGLEGALWLIASALGWLFLEDWVQAFVTYGGIAIFAEKNIKTLFNILVDWIKS